MSIENKIRDLMDIPPDDLSLDKLFGLDPEERAVVQAGSWAKKLQRKEDYRKSVATLIAARQLYAVAYIDLQRMLDGEKEGKPEAAWPHPLTEDLLVQAAMQQASKPFSEHDLVQGMVHTVMPYLAEVVDKHTAFDEEQSKKYWEEKEKERRAMGVPIGFHVDTGLEDDPPEIPRHRPLVLAGWSKAVYWVLRHIAQFTVSYEENGHAFRVVHFADGMIRPGDGHARLTRVGKSLWGGCADTHKKMPTVMGVLLDKMSGPPDLVVCDNLVEAYTKGYKGRHPGADAGDGNKGIFRWCKEAGCALLGGVPLDEEETPDTSHPAFEQLRTFSRLRPVVVERTDDDKFRIRVGKSTTSWEVDRTELEGAAPSNILVPGGAP